MMRPGDKLASYAALAEALARPEAPDLRLDIVGDGADRGAVEALFAPLAPRVRFLGAEADPARLRRAMEAADLLVWPGVNEGFGMVYLEAQAAGLPALAEDRPGPRHVLPAPPAGLPLPPPGDPAAYAATLAALDADRARLAALRGTARAHAEARHGLEAASARLRELLTEAVDPDFDLEPWDTRSLLSELWPAQRRLLEPRVEEADARYRALLAEVDGSAQR